MEAAQKRHTAIKLSIRSILNAPFIITEGPIPDHLLLETQEVARVNIIATVVDKALFGNQTTIMLDDGNYKVSARSFETSPQLEGISLGDVVQIIGRPREYNKERYILIEIIKSVEPQWLAQRAKELEKNKLVEAPAETIEQQNVQETQREKTEEKEEPGKTEEDPASRIFKFIKEHDEGGGVPIESLEAAKIENADNVVAMMLREGDLFEIKPGKVKILE